jgi:predicted nucleotidyltransferase
MAVASLDTISQQLRTVCEKHHVARLRLFGSTAAGTDGPNSDVDLLVDYDPGYTPTFSNLVGLEQELSKLFDGRPIDLARPQDVHWFIRRSVLASARTVYER